MNDEPPAGPGEEPGAIESRSIFRGRLLDVRVDRVRFPDGSEGRMEVVRHGGAAAALPLHESGHATGRDAPAVTLIRQYRYATGGPLWEVPAGRLDPGEAPAHCAARELEEETGLRAGTLASLGTIWTTPGFTDEVVHLFLATELRPGRRAHERHEFIECHEMPLTEALEMIDRGEIADAKTVAALLLAARRLYDRPAPR
ncbi:MAG: NUDIX hydrolase [Gemmatimonadota bacterium]|nr:NUDIX hydrolase [Gemmatimonadota bacterium]